MLIFFPTLAKPRLRTAAITMSNKPDRLEGKRYYDRENDESFTVLTSRHGASGLVETQYDDGVSWDEMALPDDVSEEGAERFGVEVEGLDSERYVPLGPGPTIRRSQELCDGDHDWFPLPSHLGWDDPEVWYSEIDSAADDLGVAYCRPVDLYNLVARCKRCGLSAESIISFTGDGVPGVCMECGIDLVPKETSRVWLRDVSYCSDCATRSVTRKPHAQSVVEPYQNTLTMGNCLSDSLSQTPLPKNTMISTPTSARVQRQSA